MGEKVCCPSAIPICGQFRQLHLVKQPIGYGLIPPIYSGAIIQKHYFPEVAAKQAVIAIPFCLQPAGNLLGQVVQYIIANAIHKAAFLAFTDLCRGMHQFTVTSNAFHQHIVTGIAVVVGIKFHHGIAVGINLHVGVPINRAAPGATVGIVAEILGILGTVKLGRLLVAERRDIFHAVRFLISYLSSFLQVYGNSRIAFH